MAVGDYVLDGQNPPPFLLKALNYEKWGIGDIMKLPAGMLTQINVSLNCYHALMGYKSAAGRTAVWTKGNPAAWEIVSYILEQRWERINGDSHK